MRFVIALTLLGVVSMTHAYSTARVASLVSDISDGNFEGAVQTTLQLGRERKLHLIREAVDGLYQNSERNFLEYAYRLFQDGGYMIARQVFSSEVQAIFDGLLVTFRNSQDGLSLKFGRNIDTDGERLANGDGANNGSNPAPWLISYMWENNHMYFYIYSTRPYQYLKLAYSAADNGDHIAYGGNRPTDDRFKWYLVPARFEGVNLFYIVNKHFDQALKLGRAVDNEGDRIAYGHNGYYLGKPEQLSWYITVAQAAAYSS